MTDLSRLFVNICRLLPAALGLLLLLMLLPPAVAAAEWKERPARYAVLLHQPESANTAEQLAGMIDPIVEQMAALHDYTLARPFTVRIYSSADAYAQSSDLARTSFGETAQVGGQPRELAISEPRLRNLTPEQIRNVFRRGLSQLILDDLTRGQMPIGLLQGAAQYSEAPSPEVEVGARALDKARRDRLMLSWADLNTPQRFVGQSEVAAAQGYAAVAFLLDRYGLAPWQRYITALRNTTDPAAALTTAYGKPAATLENEWLAYLPEYFGSSFQINYFARYDLGVARGHLQAGRYFEARDELEAMAKFVVGASRAAKEAEIKDLARQVTLGLEGDQFLQQGRSILATFDYAGARDTFTQARQRYETVGAGPKVEEANQALATAESGVTALVRLDDAMRLLAELKYGDAQTAALEASQTFATLGDEARYRQSYLILQELTTTQTRLAYLLGGLALVNVLWAVWRLRGQARRRAIPGVLQ